MSKAGLKYYLVVYRLLIGVGVKLFPIEGLTTLFKIRFGSLSLFINIQLINKDKL